MPIPPALLDAAAQHPCFSGVFDPGNRVQVHQDPAAPPAAVIDFQCEDCLTFRLGCLESDLPPNVTHSQAAKIITEHVRTLRGYALSVAGYHTIISDWLSAIYWDAAGLFGLRADRGSSAGKSALDVLIHAMQKGLVKPTHPAMLDPKQYVTQEVYLSVVPPPKVTSKAALLASPHVSTSWKQGFSKVTLAEVVPLAPAASAPVTSLQVASAAPAQTTAAAPAPAPARQATLAPKVVGEICTVCGAVVGERQLFTSSYVGCLCG